MQPMEEKLETIWKETIRLKESDALRKRSEKELDAKLQKVICLLMISWISFFLQEQANFGSRQAILKFS